MNSAESETVRSSTACNMAVIPINVIIQDMKLNNPDGQSTMAATPYNKQRVPPEVILHLIELMINDKDTKYDKPTIICLGLTAKPYWDFLKSKYPMQKLSPTSSCFQSCLCPASVHPRWGFLNIDDKKRLATLLKTWIGPDYRPVSDAFLNYSRSIACQIMFLRRDVYGDVPDDGCMRDQEKALMERLIFWKEYPVREWPRHGIPFRSPKLKTLPNPYGMGMEWYPTAAKEVRGMICQWKGSDNVHRGEFLNATKFSFWFVYNKSCLWKWVQEDDEEDLPEIKMVKKDLRDSENRIWRPVMVDVFGIDDDDDDDDDDVTEVAMSNNEVESETTADTADGEEPVDRISVGQRIRGSRVLLGLVLILSVLILAFTWKKGYGYYTPS